ncbi:protein hunchback [Eupeodes corollae]|uniref:protein hunchback n=1 Tax=Eupeodes corollae TaxID=290404 RepID=UPI002490395F|nr:protein hunchback [Eupeodes corollae]
MQNWDTMQPAANYEQNWYSNMFHQTIKQEPTQSTSSTNNQLEHYLNMKQQELSSVMTPSPRATESNVNATMTNGDVNNTQHYFDSTTGMLHQHHPLGFNPLTPPGLPNAILPSMSHFYQQNSHQPVSTAIPVESVTKMEQHSSNNSSLTPRNTPPMDVTPPKSPKLSLMMATSSELDQDVMSSNSSEDMKYLESEDDESIRMPIYNSHGKMKNYKCKTCGFLAITKVAFWEHARCHMKPEKTLQCSKCPFVTELKHHLEYHIRKHKNIKPFQCDKCNYSCVNKSMLNSHRKSHSSVYQYRCSDCDYATKYCHSFKLHLRKYDHKPGMVLDEDGAPNPSVVIDVYGTRRGPKMKSGRKEPSGASKMPQLSAALQGFALNQHTNHHNMPASPAKSTTSSSSEIVANAQSNNSQHNHKQSQQSHSAQQEQIEHNHQQHQQQISNLIPSSLSAILQQQRNIPFFPYWNLNLQMLAAQQQAAVLAQLSPQLRETALQNLQNKRENEDDDNDERDESCDGTAMDLTSATPTKNNEDINMSIVNLKLKEEDQQETPLISSSNQFRRKGRALKLDTALQAKEISLSPEERPRLSPNPTEVPSSSSFDDPSKESENGDSSTPSNSTSNPTTSTPTTTTNVSPPSGTIFECKYCDIYFRDAVLYTIHMGYHSCDDVFKCNMCGEKCDGPVGLFVHMARNAHS